MTASKGTMQQTSLTSLGIHEMNGFSATVMAEANPHAAVADKGGASPQPSDEKELSKCTLFRS
jgi:hypothetical protein